MIIKLDHIAYTCKKDGKENIKKRLEQYQTVFEEDNVKNLLIKKDLMDNWQEDHDLSLMEKEDDLPVEITAYEKVSKADGKYKPINNRIWVATNSKPASIFFYEKIGFRGTGEGMQIKPLMGISPIDIELHEKSPLELDFKNHYLDTEGYCCLAFVTNQINREIERLKRCDISTTEIMNLTLHDRSMSIFFAYNDQGDICEFIGIQ